MNQPPIFARPEVCQKEIVSYIEENSFVEPDVLKEIRHATNSKVGKMSMMLTSPIQVQFMRLIVKSINAKKCIEVGVFTGYNVVSTALALPDDGKVIGCDINEKFVNIGKEIWTKAGLERKIDIRLAPASETLDQLIADGQSGTFDSCYIDADKDNYDVYYEKCLELLRPNGIIFIDNMLWMSQVLKPENEMSHETLCLHNLTKKIKKDERVDGAFLAISDGVVMCRKK